MVKFKERIIEYKLFIEEFIKTKDATRWDSGNRKAIIEFLQIYEACDRILERCTTIQEEVDLREFKAIEDTIISKDGVTTTTTPDNGEIPE